MKDLHSNIKPVKTILSRSLTGTSAITGSDVDRQGFEALEYIVSVGASADTLSGALKFDIILEHADADSTGAAAGTYTPVSSADDVIGVTPDSNGIFASIDAAGKASALYSIGYRGEKRFSRIKLQPTGNHVNGTPVSATAILGTPGQLPVV